MAAVRYPAIKLPVGKNEQQKVRRRAERTLEKDRQRQRDAARRYRLRFAQRLSLWLGIPLAVAALVFGIAEVVLPEGRSRAADAASVKQLLAEANDFMAGHAGSVGVITPQPATADRDHRLEQARRKLDAALAIDPKHAPTRELMGVYFAQTGNLSRALEELRFAIKLDPRAPTAYVGLGNVLYTAGYSDEAIRSYRTAVDLDPTAVAAHQGLGAALLDRYGQARAQAEADAPKEYKVIEKTPGMVTDFGLGVVRRPAPVPTTDAEAGVQAFSRAIQLSPNNPALRSNLAVGYHALGNYTAGVKEARQAVALDPDLPQAHHVLAMNLMSIDDLDGAISSLRVAISKAPNDSSLFSSLAFALDLHKDTDRAIAAALHTLHLDRSDRGANGILIKYRALDPALLDAISRRYDTAPDPMPLIFPAPNTN